MNILKRYTCHSTFFLPLVLMVLCVALSSTKLTAQVLPPDFQCVNNDTLFWSPVSNDCGDFISYQIYFSNSPDGGFSLLTEIFDPTITFYEHLNPGGLWYYYLQSNYDCPGETVLPSVTLNNQSPERPVFHYVTVENGAVEIHWSESSSPEVIGYIIYRETSLGIVPIDTVYDATNYTDLLAEPEATSENYYVLSLDPCGTTSISGNPQHTILVNAAIDTCDEVLTLDWNLYENWTSGIERHEVWLSIDGGVSELVAVLGAESQTFEYNNLFDGATYCFTVHAVENNTAYVSKSNTFCLELDIVQPMQGLYVENVSVTPVGEVEVTWGWLPTAEIINYTVQRSLQSSSELTIVEQVSIAPPLPDTPSLIDASANPEQGILTYDITTEDACGRLAISTMGNTIFLSGVATDVNQNQLTWSPLGVENSTALSYELYRLLDGTETLVAVYEADEFMGIDELPLNSGAATPCYYLLAHGTLLLPDGTEKSIISRSNEFCVPKQARLFMPNAFAPRGVNQAFKPLLVNGSDATFQMEIYNRYGQLIFTTTDAFTGWNGKLKSGRDARPGVYVYVITLQQANGETETHSGNFMLIR